MTVLYSYPPQTLNISPDSIKFLLNDVITDVSSDTITPANSKPLPVSALSLPLPGGASTSLLQTTGNSSLSSIDGKFTTLNAKDFSTSAKQDTANISLSSINTKLTSPLTTKIGNGIITADIKTLGTQVVATDNGLIVKSVMHGITTGGGAGYVDVKVTPSGALTTESVVTGSVAVTNFPATQPVSGSVSVSNFPATQAVTGAFFQATQPISAAALPLPSGASTLTEQQTQTTAIGSLTETAPATDTASSGLNGRLQRIAQRLTSLIALFPSSIGTKASAASLSVVLASDQVAIGVTPGTSSGAITQIQKSVGTSAVRATVSGSAPSATRKRLLIKPSKNNIGSIYLGSSSVTIAAGLEIIGPDRLEFLLDSSDYFLISDTASQVVEIIEVA